MTLWLANGDTNKAIEKGVGTAVSLFFDLTGTSTLYNAVSSGAKAGVQQVAKKGTQEVAEAGITFAFKSVSKEFVFEKTVEYGGKKITTRMAAKHVAKECSVHMSERVLCLLATKGICHCVNCKKSCQPA